ncbi:hypothetical protein EJ08DRAFT_390268 [Tothia fuscella]|uniref:Uncharacterized protein n=1 Tax=Tothia fuscella TaxID=1048955 RepID=A0A9P4P0N1_9PEZI|nr:hypothetical protein EJ08DRAFT_390268 [Tothia fuscella]
MANTGLELLFPTYLSKVPHGFNGLATIELAKRRKPVWIEIRDSHCLIDGEQHSDMLNESYRGLWMLKMSNFTKAARFVLREYHGSSMPLQTPKIVLNRCLLARYALIEEPNRLYFSIVQGGQTTLRKLVVSTSREEVLRNAFYEACNGYSTLYTIAIAEPKLGFEIGPRKVMVVRQPRPRKDYAFTVGGLDMQILEGGVYWKVCRMLT